MNSLPPPVPGSSFDVETAAGRIAAYQLGEGRTVLLLHSFNAAGSGIELRALAAAGLGSRTTTSLATPTERGTRLVQAAFFEPTGLSGLVYWYALHPVHGLICRRTVRVLARRSSACRRREARLREVSRS